MRSGPHPRATSRPRSARHGPRRSPARSRGRGRSPLPCACARGPFDGSGRRSAPVRPEEFPGRHRPQRPEPARPRALAETRTTPPAPVCSIAFWTRFRSTWASRSPSAIRRPRGTAPDLHAPRRQPAPRSPRCLGDERLEVDPTRPGTRCPRRSGRAESGRRRADPSWRSLDSPPRRWLRPRSRDGDFERPRISIWPRIAVSGVRSSCDASETNARCRANASSSRSSMRLNDSASWCTSRAPPSGIRSERSPASTAPAALAIRRSGEEMRAAAKNAASSAAATVSEPAIRKVFARPSWARSTGASG